ncbi:Peptidase family M23 [compost metagenome]
MNNLKFLLFLTNCFIWLNVNAQVREVTITTKRNKDGSVNLIANKSVPGNYTIALNLTSSSNTSEIANPVFNIRSDGDNFLTFYPNNKDQDISLSYTYKVVLGKLNPKFNPNFLYTLPYADGKKTKVTTKSPAIVNIINFYTEQADTVVAIRKGTIVKSTDLYDDDNNNYEAKRKHNALMIEHEDGTLASYQGLRKGFLVKVGQVVFPGDALAINNVSADGYFFVLHVNYLKSVEVINKKGEKLNGNMHGTVKPYFSTKEDANNFLRFPEYYTSIITKEIIQKEMTKKEIKNLGKK